MNGHLYISIIQPVYTEQLLFSNRCLWRTTCYKAQACAWGASALVKTGSGQWRGRYEVDYGRPDSSWSGVWAFSQRQRGTVQSPLWTMLAVFYTPTSSPWQSLLKCLSPAPVLSLLLCFILSQLSLSSFSLLQSAPNTAVDLIDVIYNQTQFGLCSAHNIFWLYP